MVLVPITLKCTLMENKHSKQQRLIFMQETETCTLVDILVPLDKTHQLSLATLEW
jgi:hypothetical protein